VAFSDADLIARVLLADDRHAFRELVRRHQSVTRALLRRLTQNAAAADDLAQETFLRAYRGLRGYRGNSRFSTWIGGIAYRVFLTQSLRGRVDVVLGQPGQVDERYQPSPAGLADLRHDLRRAMSVLGPDERVALCLAYGSDSTHEEIAEILGWPLGTVKTRILRAKEKLRGELGGWEEAGALS
jgi:RNA polymerase sigma-70 factor (ECF subfamily)